MTRTLENSKLMAKKHRKTYSVSFVMKYTNEIYNFMSIRQEKIFKN